MVHVGDLEAQRADKGSAVSQNVCQVALRLTNNMKTPTPFPHAKFSRSPYRIFLFSKSIES